MKNTLFPIVLAFTTSVILMSCFSSDTRHENYTTQDLEGDWTLIKVEVIEEKQSLDRFKEDGGEKVQEWSPPVFKNNEGILYPGDDDFFSIRNRDLHIQGDSIFWLNYPLELEQKNAYTIEVDLLKLENNTDHRQISLSRNRDTLSMSYMMDYGLYVKETYQRVTFNDSLLNILKLYKINLPLLAGTWAVVREGSCCDDGSEYTLNFPYKIPDLIQITREELTDILFEGETYKMMTDGKKRDYSLVHDGWMGELTLSPANWLPAGFEGDTEIYLNRVSKERQQVSPQECWAEFLQVITSGNKHSTIDLMTDDGYNDLRKNVNPLEMEITLKRRGQEWQDWEITWGEISKTNATAKFGPKDKEKNLEFVKVDGLWYIDALTDGE